jgi:AsmA protein
MKIRMWLRRLAGLLVLLIALSYAFSFALRLGRAHRYLERRLSAAFGRPVEVGRFSVSLITGPRLEAERVTVGEDPAFGYEYFLRAERLAAGLRWGQLLRGRFEFGTLSFTRPSLNLVRDTDGRWNIERWLPSRTSGPSQLGAASAGRLYRIDFDTGRINLKYGPV